MSISGELTEIYEKKEKLERKSNFQFGFSSTELQPEEKMVYELRDLLTFIKSYKQMIDANHPEAKEFEHWEQIDVDMEAMALRLMEYEKRLHTA